MSKGSPDIGVGFVGCTHPHIFPRITLLQSDPTVRIIGSYDPDSRLSRALEDRFGIPQFSDLNSLLDCEGLNFVVIEGWDTDNPAFVEEAARRGQAILLEKPGAPNLASMREMLAFLRRHPVPFDVGYQLRHSPVMPAVRDILADGVLGPVTLIRTHAAAPVGGAAEPWQSVPGDLGGLIYTDGCHMIDLIVHLLGAPTGVKGSILTLPAGPPVIAHDFKADTLAEPATVEMSIGGLVWEDAGAAILEYDDKLVT
ncbi:MAG: Gfo/Idh/MocA family oxidoreductase, partial [Thermomicrobiales bacterium]|nr:Gfo/Idh/MocA family oxidoreductase [Thermomicrobiales bacterium]